ncbi:MAG: SMC family ATPase [Gammaproteobacteria bacterium]|nr:MAG: SMC family ATPase [Gammaproteobacteria bacterium]
MKPIKLTIQAFGPFVGKEEIDFSKLGENPLFLINGPTGSGKSSILDAMCFALYGKTTGDEREAAQMRCDQADPKILTEVILDFSLGEKIYRIKRSPNQERAKVHGEGLAAHVATAELNEVDAAGELSLIVSKKVKQATSEIERLTGLNVEQFRQVMVLPQGKFRELLLASSYDREQIFAQLFQTQIYKKIEYVLKEKSKIIRDNVKAHEDKIKGILEGAGMHTEDEVKTYLDESKPQLDEAKKHKDITSTAYQEAINHKKSAEALIKDFADLEKTKLRIDKKNKKKPEIDSKQNEYERAQQANKIKPVFDGLARITNEKQLLNIKINDAEIELKKIKNELDDSGKDLNKTKDAANAIDGLKQKAVDLHRFEKKVGELESARSVLQKSKVSFEASVQAEVVAQEKYDEKDKNKKTMQERAATIRKDQTDLGAKQVNLQKLGEQIKDLQKLDKNRSIYDDLIAQRDTANENFKSFSEIFESSATYAKTQEIQWHAGQAAILAEELQDGIACPVCGSEDHPLPAKMNEDQKVISKEQMEEARAQAENNRADMQSAKDAVTKIKSQIETTKSSIKELEKELGDVALETLEAIVKAYITIESEVTTLKSLKQELVTLDNDLAKCNSDIDELLNATKQCKEKAGVDKIQYTQDQSAVKHIESDLPEEYRDKSTLLTAIEEVETKAQSLVDALTNAQTHYDQCKESVTKQATNLQGLTVRKVDLSDQQIKQQDKWLKSLNSSSFEAEQQYLQSILEEDQLKELNSEIITYHKDLNKIKGALKQQAEALKGKSKPEMNSLNELCDEKAEEFKLADKSWNNLHSRVTQLKDVRKKLKKAHEENKKLEAEYAIYGTLSKVANGQTGNKISLQRFVLSVLLDDVLIEASAKFYMMSNGRYQLLRKQDRSKGGGASGLELDVEDAYTGKTRSVATLSGGESFMAALALALGLSDVVQAYAGGIRLDALFIDEGFGSLDQESLDLAIKTLVDLQETGRMIGIISHVSELKEQMALRLDVISSKTGSTIKTIAA